MSSSSVIYSSPTRPGREAHAASSPEAKARLYDIDSVFDPAALKGKRILITGCTRGLGFALAKEAIAAGADVIAVNRSPGNVEGAVQVIDGVDVTSDEAVLVKMVKELEGGAVDIVVNNAGYFREERESILEGTMDFKDHLKTIDICSVGVLRVTHALFSNKLLKEGSKVIIISSQGASVKWREDQSPEGGDYGHHVSKSAVTMTGVLIANELRGKVAVGILHPGFNKTGTLVTFWSEPAFLAGRDPSFFFLTVLIFFFF